MKKLRQPAGAVFLCILSFSVMRREPMTAGAYDTLTAEIPVHCMTAEPLTDHVYEIRMEPDGSGMPEPEQTALQIEAGAVTAFMVPLTEPGTYKYRIYEEAGSLPDVTYDSTVYLVMVFAENGADDTLRYAVSAAEESGSKAEEICFADDVHIVTTTTEAVTTVTETVTAAKTTEPVTEPETTAPPPATTRRSGGGVFTGDNMPVKLLFSVLCGASLTAGIAYMLRNRKKRRE